MFVSIHEVSYFAKHCVCVCVCVCVYVFWKCCFLFWIFRFDLCFYRDPLAKEIVQLMTETDKIKTSNNNNNLTGTNQMIPTRDLDSASDIESSDILMPGFMLI